MPQKHAGKHTNRTQRGKERLSGEITVLKQGVMYATSALATYLLKNKPVYFFKRKTHVAILRDNGQRIEATHVFVINPPHIYQKSLTNPN